MRRTSVLTASALLMGLGAASAAPAMAAPTPTETGRTVTTTSSERFYSERTTTQGDYKFSDVYSDSFSERKVESQYERTGADPVSYTHLTLPTKA